MNNIIKSLLLTIAFLYSCTFFSSCSKDSEGTPILDVSNSSIEVKEGGVIFTVSSNMDWTLSQSGHRFTVSPTRGEAGYITEVGIAYEPNNSDEDWSSTFTISSEKLTKTILVTQPKLSLSLNPQTLEFEAAGGTKSITVTSNTDWGFDNTSMIPMWCMIESKGSSGNGEIDVTVSENTTAEPRNWTLKVVYGNNRSESVVITQKAASN